MKAITKSICGLVKSFTDWWIGLAGPVFFQANAGYVKEEPDFNQGCTNLGNEREKTCYDTNSKSRPTNYICRRNRHARSKFPIIRNNGLVTMCVCRCARIMRRFIRAYVMIILLAIAINALSKSVYPELPNDFPFFFWGVNWLVEAVNHAFKSVLGAVYALFHGNLDEFSAMHAVNELEIGDDFYTHIIDWLTRF